MKKILALVLFGLTATAPITAIPAVAQTVAAEQTVMAKNTMTFFFVGLETFTGIVLFALLLFLNVEKDIGNKQAEIKERKKEGKADESN